MSKVPIDDQIKALEANIAYKQYNNESVTEELKRLEILNQQRQDFLLEGTEPESLPPLPDESPITKAQLKQILNDTAITFTQALQRLEENTTKRVNDLSASYQQALNETAANLANQGIKPQGGKYDEIIKSVMEIVKARITEAQQTPNQFEQELLENYKREALESVNIVSLINKKVKSALTGRIAGDIATDVISQSAEKISHGP